MNVKINQSYKCNFVLCQSCLLLVLTFLTCSTLTLTLRKMFPNKDGSSVDGKSFSDGGIFVVFPRTISLFLLRCSFFSIISVFKPKKICSCCFQKKNWDPNQVDIDWFHEKRFEILFFKTMFVLLGYPPIAQFDIDFMKRGLKYFSSKQCLSFWDILRWLNSLWGAGIPMRWSCSFPRKLYWEKSENNCWYIRNTYKSSIDNYTADLGRRAMCLKGKSHPQQRMFL